MLATLLLSLIAASPASTPLWEEIYSYPGETSSSNFFWGAALDPQGNHWLASSALNPKTNASHWETQVAAIGTANYEIVDRFELVPGSYNRSAHISFSEAGRPFVTGTSKPSDTENRWIVRSTDVAGKWSTVLDGAALGFANSTAGGTIVVGNRILAIGATGDPLQWTIAEADLSDKAGPKWQILERHSDAEHYSSGLRCLDHSGSKVLIAGSVLTTKGATPQAVAQVSTDGGRSWSFSAPISTAKGNGLIGSNSCYADSEGRLFLTVIAVQDGQNIGSELQMSDDSGKSWKVIDSFYPDHAVNVVGHGAVVDGQGVIYYPYHGLWENDDGYLVRRSEDGGKTFETIDRYRPTDLNFHAGASSATLNSLGELLIGGYEEIPGGGQKLIVRKLIP